MECSDLMLGMPDSMMIVEVQPPTVRFSRGVLLYMAVSHLLFAYGTWKTHDVEIWALWPILFLVAGTACIWAAARFACQIAVSIAAAATVTAFASRALLVMVAWSYGIAYQDPGKVILAAGSWSTVTVLSAVVFTRGMAPLSARLRRLG